MDLLVTLAERDHFYGVFALFNSVSKSGFTGTFVIGYRDFDGVPPRIVELLKKAPFDNKEVQVELVKLETTKHFTNYKPDWMSICLKKCPQANRILYLDPDIVLACPWNFIASWIDSGVALCADVNWHMPPDHPIRHQWRKIMASENLKENNRPVYYFNGGFLGLKREDFNFLSIWKMLTDRYGDEKNPLDGRGDIKCWMKGARWDRIMSPDQDTLNIATMAWSGTLAYAGPDAMGFSQGNIFCTHSIGAVKPWRRRYIRETIFSGIRPGISDIKYWENVSDPIRIFNSWIVKQKKLAIKISSGIGRFYRRGN